MLSGCKKEETDAEKFKKEYNNVSDNNLFVYKTSEEVLKYINDKDTILLFVGSNTNEWSKSIVVSLDEFTKKNGVSIYYLPLSNSSKVLEELKLSEDNSYVIGIVNGELKYLVDNNNEKELEEMVEKMAEEINSCDIHGGGC